MPKINTFLPAMCPAFFIRVSPASRKAKPACMNMTRTAVTTTQTVLTAINRSEFLGTDFHLLQASARSAVRYVVDRARPDDPVARLVAAPRGVRDRAHDRLRDRGVGDEDEQRLRQKAGL